MIIIYHCFGGSHSSVMAAALHLNLIEKDRVPTAQDMMALPYYDKTNDLDFGSLRYMGMDDSGNKVYVLGKKGLGDKCTRIIMGVARLLRAENDIMAINCMPKVNWLMKLGGFASRRLGWTRWGRPVVLNGTQRAFFDLVNLVEVIRLKSRHEKRVLQ